MGSEIHRTITKTKQSKTSNVSKNINVEIKGNNFLKTQSIQRNAGKEEKLQRPDKPMKNQI
jgi:hypothetical protein